MHTFLLRLRQFFCKHEVSIREIVRVPDNAYREGYVACRCRKCHKKLIAAYGLALPAKLVQ